MLSRGAGLEIIVRKVRLARVTDEWAGDGGPGRTVERLTALLRAQRTLTSMCTFECWRERGARDVGEKGGETHRGRASRESWAGKEGGREM